MSTYIISILIGLLAGFLSGLVGIGGGIVMVPALVYFLKFNQHLAQGTTLAAMLLPIGIFAVWEYYKAGFVNIPVALLLVVGFTFSSYFSSKLALSLNPEILRKVFAVFLFAISLKLFFGK